MSAARRRESVEGLVGWRRGVVFDLDGEGFLAMFRGSGIVWERAS